MVKRTCERGGMLNLQIILQFVNPNKQIKKCETSLRRQ